MAKVDAQAGAARYAAKTTNRPGMCLAECQVAMKAPPSIGRYAGQYPTAYSAWLHDTAKHTDANPPRGALVYFGPSPTRTDKNKNAGDVCISLGKNSAGVTLIRCSDGAGAGRMATMTIAARARQIARPYLGWVAPIFLGHTLVNLGSTGGNMGTTTVTAAYVLGQLGAAYLKKLQTQLGVKADGKWGPITAKALQRKVSTPADGVWGRASNIALQKALSILPDGKWGPATTLALKHAIDAGKWAPVAPPPPPPPAWEPPTKAEWDALTAEVASLTAAARQQGADILALKANNTALTAKISAAVKALA